MKVTYIAKEQNWQSESTVYWFAVGGVNYGISVCNGKITPLDCDGCPIEGPNYNEIAIIAAITIEYEKFKLKDLM